MLGKLSSVYSVLDTLKAVAVRNWAVKEFVQGTKTRRWAVAWSFQSARPAKDVARGMSGLPKKLLPFPPVFTFEAPSALSDHFYEHLQELFDDKEIEWRFDRTTSAACGWARGNVWSRAARRHPGTVVGKVIDRPKPVDKAVAEQDRDGENKKPRESRFIFRIQIYTGKPRSRAMEVQVRWLAGLEMVVFESFCAFVKSKLTELELDANPK
ncbi:Methyltransferase-like protein 16 [Pseudocyphellaria aurata]|nr:Methyltransferase-like protein 16 [Pseudocyphellaria aurata]